VKGRTAMAHYFDAAVAADPRVGRIVEGWGARGRRLTGDVEKDENYRAAMREFDALRRWSPPDSPLRNWLTRDAVLQEVLHEMDW
jgi:hypothetical protein